MSKNLIVVESPAKARTISKYLGRDFKALASYGHVRDLKPKTGAVDPDNQFEMNYEVIERNKKHVDAIARALKNSDALSAMLEQNGVTHTYDRVEGWPHAMDFFSPIYERTTWFVYQFLKEHMPSDELADGLKH